jgi:ADP-heptose:LPS heptosyltransferase
LKELVALLEMARLFVGNDSGPMHIAAALGRPIVAVWGTSDPTVWHPWTEAPWRIVDGRRSAGDGRCLAISQIGASEVTAAVDEVLELALAANRKVVSDSAYRARVDNRTGHRLN